ncbi:MAG: LuxR family transcriptional regulator [Clostridia bacterium]|nr:LuxR family transcriptional regulator [Clostridia bacterium]NCC43966.1 LuxR family transcriptional regulator [Clostridia bacterium]
MTSNLPSIMNGGLDFCEWSRNDKELAVLLKKPIEVVLGKYGVGLVNIALAESGFEKGTMDTYEVMTRLNTGYMMSDTGGKIEMSFAAIGLLARLHLSRGQSRAAQRAINSFREKVIKENADWLIPNLDAMEIWMQLLTGKNEQVAVWMEKAPNEGVSFCCLERYRYIQKVRCLIAMKAYGEAGSLVERLNLYFTEYERNYMWMENQVLKAIIQYRIGNTEWKDTLEQVLIKMEKYHFVRIAAQEGAAIQPLLEELEETTVSEEYLNLIKQEVDKMAHYYPNYLGKEKKLKEPLTDMEMQIVKLLCEEQTSQQICEICGFTYSTLKFHNRNIYRKLGVKNRKEAEDVAKRLEIYEG